MSNTLRFMRVAFISASSTAVDCIAVELMCTCTPSMSRISLSSFGVKAACTSQCDVDSQIMQTNYLPAQGQAVHACTGSSMLRKYILPSSRYTSPHAQHVFWLFTIASDADYKQTMVCYEQTI